MTRAAPALALVLALVPGGAAAQGSAREGRGEVAPSGAIKRVEKSIADLVPRIILQGGYYSGAFDIAAGIYCDRRTGEIYVADQGANSIEIFSEEGVPLFAFTDDEHLSGPVRVAVDPEDRIYVLDSEEERIKVFDYRGEFLRYLVPAGFEGQRLALTALAFGENGDLFIGESASGQVVVTDREGRLKLRFGSFGEGAEQFSTIVGIAVDKENVYVASQQGIAVQVFSRSGRFLRGWGHHDAGVHNVSLPSGIAVDAQGRIVLLDTLRQEIKYFDNTGGFIGLYAGLGRLPGAVAYPRDLSIDRRGRLCVADTGNRRGQVLEPVEAVPGENGGPRRAGRPASPPLSIR